MDAYKVYRDYCYEKPGAWNICEGSDISAHLPVLRYFGSHCKTIVEFGVRSGYSTSAFVVSGASEVFSYDIEHSSGARLFQGMQNLPCKFTFTVQDTGAENFSIPYCDLIFFDTLHTYSHLKKELRHAYKSRKYLAFHDTETCGEVDRSGFGSEGITRAIQEYMSNDPCKIVYETKENNGLLVLRRINV